jgi:hypothetical protein
MEPIVGTGKKKFPPSHVECAGHTRCRGKQDIYVQSARFHFTKEAVLRGTTLSNNTNNNDECSCKLLTIVMHDN